jgi:hypothetical protein
MGAFDYSIQQSPGIKPTGLINGGGSLMYVQYAGGGSGPLRVSSAIPGVKGVLSGACTANILKPILSLSGRGALTFAALAGQDITPRTNRLVVVVDGAVITDQSGANTQPSNIPYAAPVVGGIGQGYDGVGTIFIPLFEALLFEKSLQILYSSSLTETDKCLIGYRYIPR